MLKAEGYIRGYEEVTEDGHPELEISLKYFDGQPVIRELRRVSTPGRRVYSGVKEIPQVRQGLGVAIVSTPQGRHVRCTGPHRQRRRRGPLHRVLRRGSMSRIGKKPVDLPGGVTATVSGQTVEVKGPKGTRAFTATDDVTIARRGRRRHREAARRSPSARASSGACRAPRSRTSSTGVTTGFKKEMEITGVGYRAAVQGKVLKLSLGYSHDVDFAIPAGVTITTPKPTEIIVEGIDQQVVGQVAANIREWRKPEPYKGKGIRYKGEFIFRKEGKKK